jgi:hypothetical protein
VDGLLGSQPSVKVKGPMGRIVALAAIDRIHPIQAAARPKLHPDETLDHGRPLDVRSASAARSHDLLLTVVKPIPRVEDSAIPVLQQAVPCEPNRQSDQFARESEALSSGTLARGMLLFSDRFDANITEYDSSFRRRRSRGVESPPAGRGSERRYRAISVGAPPAALEARAILSTILTRTVYIAVESVATEAIARGSSRAEA